MIHIKSEQDLIQMRASAAVLKALFQMLSSQIKPGISTKYLDQLAYDFIMSQQSLPACLHYNGFPATLCVSIDDQVVHGIPSGKTFLADGQIVSIDTGVITGGFYTDAARSYLVGECSTEKKQLVAVTEQCFFKGIEGIQANSRLGDISGRIQIHAESFGYGVVTALTGHGVGTAFHEDPAVPNVGKVGTGMRLISGMTLAVEPMINLGTEKVDFLDDGWTVRTKDRKPSSHYENTILITDNGVEILTL